MTTPAACNNCKFFYSTSLSFGDCRCLPPGYNSARIEVAADYWCGAWVAFPYGAIYDAQIRVKGQ